MRRWALIVCGLLFLIVQGTLAPRLAIAGARPDWLLVLVVFAAMHAPPADALLSAWAVGFCADLMSVERTGLLAITYALAALLVVSLREYIFRHSAVIQFVVTLGIGLLVRAAWLGYRHALYDPAEGVWVGWLYDGLWGSVYTAAWAPLIQPSLVRATLSVELRKPRYTHAGLHRLSRGRV